MTVRVSQSKARLFRACKQAYHFKHVENLKKRRIRRPFQFGRIIHSMIEADANGDDPFEVLDGIALDNRKLFAAEKEMYGEIVKDAKTIMKAYRDFWPSDSLEYLRKNKRSAEHKFELEIEPGVVATGIIDAVVRTPNKLKWLCEHKTFTRLPNNDHRWRNLQSVVYLKMIEQLGWWSNISGVCWNYVRSKEPSIPQVLKSGQLSTKRCDTLPSVVHEVLKKHKLNPKDYKDFIGEAEKNQKSFFIRVFTPVKPPVVEKLYKGFIDTARKIAQYHETQEKEMSIGHHCEFCDYEPICRAELTDSDVDFIKERDYYVSESSEEKPKKPSSN